MNWRRVEGTQEERPLEFDATTSKTIIYIRKNIERKSKTQDGNTYEVWEYDEAQIPMSEFPAVASQVICTITPWTASKTAYIDDTSITFENVPNGNMSVYVGGVNHTLFERAGDRVVVKFEPLEVVTEVAISII